MGNSALRALAVIEETTMDALSGSTIAVDAHNWLYRYLTTTVRWTDSSVYTTDDGDEVANLIGTIRGLPRFFEHDIHPVFIFDGRVTDLKADEVADRRESRQEAAAAAAKARSAGDIVEASRLESQSQRLTSVIHDTTRELFDHLEIPYLEAPAEGEAQGAHMARAGAVDYVGTEDYDALLFGAPETVRKLTTNDPPEVMDFAATLAEHDITQEQLVDIAILCGTDFNEGISGYGPKTALSAIQEHGDLWAVLETEAADIPEAEAVRSLFLDPAVTDEYTVTGEINPDLATARSYLTDEWEIPAEEIDTAFGRLEDAMSQHGLNRWT